jgi:hypothetical protein
MQVLYSPQVSNYNVEYAFDGEIVTANLNGKVDVFDFSSMPNGSTAININTSLDVNVVESATKLEDGTLKIVLYKNIPSNATEAEKFPTWIEING